ncbi:hypothetical protein F2P81_021766 [Scophthalmus maximus]|uniref:Uncharacterized protein n=1 Tax=Scophthalmus maximus TaxID=52904 RepID=A0A6A4RXN7_SCOMX|nr:hypothetical protein F2P81_021766 [Scophthalmus maximus]
MEETGNDLLSGTEDVALHQRPSPLGRIPEVHVRLQRTLQSLMVSSTSSSLLQQQNPLQFVRNTLNSVSRGPLRRRLRLSSVGVTPVDSCTAEFMAKWNSEPRHQQDIPVQWLSNFAQPGSEYSWRSVTGVPAVSLASFIVLSRAWLFDNADIGYFSASVGVFVLRMSGLFQIGLNPHGIGEDPDI